MFPIKKFRIGSDCNFMAAFDNYFRSNYRLEVFNQCQDFIKDLAQTRNILSYISANQSESTLDSLLSKSVSYLKTLLELNSVVNIDSYSLKINFSWKEVSQDKTTVSNNLYYISGEKECYKKCPKEAQYYYSGTYQCIPKCPDNYYHEQISPAIA